MVRRNTVNNKGNKKINEKDKEKNRSAEEIDTYISLNNKNNLKESMETTGTDISKKKEKKVKWVWLK